MKISDTTPNLLTFYAIQAYGILSLAMGVAWFVVLPCLGVGFLMGWLT